MNAAPPFTEEIYRPPVPSAVVAPQRFKLYPFKDIRLDTAPAYLIKGLIPRVGLTVIWGPPKCGKSFLTFDMVMHVALDREYRGRRVSGGTVVYCALEGAEGFRARVEAFRLERLARNASPPFHLMASQLNLVADQRAFLDAIRAQLGVDCPAVVVVDTLNRSLAGSESDDKDMAAYVRAADAVREAFGCAVIIVHHCGHNGERPRGHSSLIGAVDAQIAVKRDAAENIVATLELSKEGAAGAEIVSRLVPVEVGIDTDGDAIMSCVIEPTETTAKPQATTGRAWPASLKLFRQVVIEVTAERGIDRRAAASGPLVRAVDVEHVRPAFYKRYATGEDSSRAAAAKRQAFGRALKAAVAAQFVYSEQTKEGEYIWLP